MEKIIDLKTPITEIAAIISNNRCKVGTSSVFGDLFNSIYLSTVCHVTLTMNTWIKMGLLCFQHILHIIIKLIKILILKKKV